LVVLAVHRAQHLSLDPQDAAPYADRLADVILLGDRAAADGARGSRPARARPNFLCGRRSLAAADGHVRDHCSHGGNPAEDLERGPRATEAGRTRTAAVAGAHGGAAEPDQSAFSLQHAEFDLFAGAGAARYGATAHRQTGPHPPPPAAADGSFP